jgi:DUF1680 family protein
VTAAASSPIAPCLPTPEALAVTRPLGLDAVRLTHGLLADRQSVNGAVSIPSGRDRLAEAGNFDNLALAAGTGGGDYRGPLFMDSDLYKYAEAVAWEAGRSGGGRGPDWLAMAAGLVSAAQCDDGYLNSFVQAHSLPRYENLRNGHEHYCMGHLIQAAVAAHRATGDDAWLGIATAVAGHLESTFGADRNRGLDGHPVIESALVELFRCTGDRRHLELAQWFVEARGHATISPADPSYYTDARPARDQDSFLGHAVRALYFDAGVVDVAVETGDTALLGAVVRRVDDMIASKTALTGGVGSRHSRESFGDRFELPPDRAYNETCAAIASIQLCWRLLLATGEPRFAELIERTLVNSLVASTSADGSRYFYVNPLQRRPDHAEGADPGERRHWFECACCPPNIMRTYASLGAYLASIGVDGTSVFVHQLFPATISVGERELSIESDLPGPGTGGTATVVVTLTSGTGNATVHVRIPAWATSATARVGDEQLTAVPARYLTVNRSWLAGDAITLTLDAHPRLLAADPRVDALRSCVAVEAGGLVYCAEEADNPGVDLASVTVRPDAHPEISARQPDGLPTDLPLLDLSATLHPAAAPDWPYRPAPTQVEDQGRSVTLTLVPYPLWANRGLGAMRVWLPVG